MATNSIRARMSFSFKGETYDLDAVIDLDRYPGTPDEAPNFHLLLAKAAGIDSYSYLYEVLESYDIEFSDATGVAAQCCHEGCFDWAEFARKQGEEGDWQAVQRIASPLLASHMLDDDPALKAALLAVYRAGKAGG